MTFLLCIDTSLRGVSAALVNLEDPAAPYPAWIGAHLDVMSSASQINQLISQGLRDARTTVDSVAGVAVSVGPGSFTGIKIGLSFAAGFTMGRRDKCGVLGVSGLELALAHRCQEKGISGPASLYLAATRTHGFVSKRDRAGESTTSLIDLSHGLSQASAAQEVGWSGLIGTWPLLEQDREWRNRGGDIIPVADAVQWALHGMIDCAVKQWPHGFGTVMPEPRYMRLSTAEEKQGTEPAKE